MQKLAKSSIWELNEEYARLTIPSENITFRTFMCRGSLYVSNPRLHVKWWMYSRGELFMRSRECYFGVYFPSCTATREINTKITLEWAHTVRHKSTYIILFLTQHNESINDAKNEDLHTSSPCLTHSLYVLLMTSQSIDDEVTMTRQLWREHVTSDI